MVYICPGGNCTGIAIFFFDKVSHLKHPNVHVFVFLFVFASLVNSFSCLLYKILEYLTEKLKIVPKWTHISKLRNSDNLSKLR